MSGGARKLNSYFKLMLKAKKGIWNNDKNNWEFFDGDILTLSPDGSNTRTKFLSFLTVKRRLFSSGLESLRFSDLEFAAWFSFAFESIILPQSP